MKISGVNWESVVDGLGVRTTIFVSGCSHNCPGCHNPETHDPNIGFEFEDKIRDIIFREIADKPYIDGITMSGGDPLFSSNRTEVEKFLQEFRHKFPEKNVWLYTGYKWEEIINDKQMLSIALLCDVIVDSPFEIKKRDITAFFKGSTNQRVIDVKKSLEEKHIVTIHN